MASNKSADAATDVVAEVVLKAAIKGQIDTVKMQWPSGMNDDEILTIGELREKLDVKSSLFAGVCAANRWRSGKQLSVKEFKAAVEEFSGGAMGRSKKRCSGT